MIKKQMIYKKPIQILNAPLINENIQDINELFMYIDQGDYAQVYKLFLSKRIYFNIKLNDESVLHRLIVVSNDKITEIKKLDFINFLVENGAPINTYNNLNITPLHLAVSLNYNKIVKYLLESGSNIQSLTNDNMSVLHYATMININPCPKNNNNKLLIPKPKYEKEYINVITKNIINFFYNDEIININEQQIGIKTFFFNQIKYIRDLNLLNYINYKNEITLIVDKINKSILQRNIDIHNLEIKKIIADIIQSEINNIEKKINIKEGIRDLPLDYYLINIKKNILIIQLNIDNKLKIINDLVHDAFKSLLNLDIRERYYKSKYLFDLIKSNTQNIQDYDDGKLKQLKQLLGKIKYNNQKHVIFNLINFFYNDTFFINYTFNDNNNDNIDKKNIINFILINSFKHYINDIEIEINNNNIIFYTCYKHLINSNIDINIDINNLISLNIDDNNDNNVNKIIWHTLIEMLKLDKETEDITKIDKMDIEKYIKLLYYKKISNYDINIYNNYEIFNNYYLDNNNNNIYLLFEYLKLELNNQDIKQNTLMNILYKNYNLISNENSIYDIYLIHNKTNIFDIENNYMGKKKIEEIEEIIETFQNVSNHVMKFIDYFTLSLHKNNIIPDNIILNNTFINKIEEYFNNLQHSVDSTNNTNLYLIYYYFRYMSLNIFDYKSELDLSLNKVNTDLLDNDVKNMITIIQDLLKLNLEYMLTDKNYIVYNLLFIINKYNNINTSINIESLNDMYKNKKFKNNNNNNNESNYINNIISYYNNLYKDDEIYNNYNILAIIGYNIYKSKKTDTFDIISGIIFGCIININNITENMSDNLENKNINRFMFNQILNLGRIIYKYKYDKKNYTSEKIKEKIKDYIDIDDNLENIKNNNEIILINLSKLFMDLENLYKSTDNKIDIIILKIINVLIFSNFKLENLDNLLDNDILDIELICREINFTENNQFEKIDFDIINPNIDENNKKNIIILILLIENIGIDINNLIRNKGVDFDISLNFKSKERYNKIDKLKNTIKLYKSLIYILYYYIYFIKNPERQFYDLIFNEIKEINKIEEINKMYDNNIHYNIHYNLIRLIDNISRNIRKEQKERIEKLLKIRINIEQMENNDNIINKIIQDSFKNYKIYNIINIINDNYKSLIKYDNINLFNINNMNEQLSEYNIYELENYNLRDNKTILIKSEKNNEKNNKRYIEFENINHYNLNNEYEIKKFKLDIIKKDKDISENKIDNDLMDDLMDNIMYNFEFENNIMDLYLPLLKNLNMYNDEEINFNNIKLLINLPEYIDNIFNFNNIENENIKKFNIIYEKIKKEINNLKELFINFIETKYSEISISIKNKIDNNQYFNINIYDEIIDEYNYLFNIDVKNIENNKDDIENINGLINNKRFYNIIKLDKNVDIETKKEFINNIIDEKLFQYVVINLLNKIKEYDFNDYDFYKKCIKILEKITGSIPSKEILQGHINNIFEKITIDSVKIIIYQDIHKIFYDIINEKNIDNIDANLEQIKNIMSIFLESYEFEYNYRSLNDIFINKLNVNDINKLENIFNIKLIEDNGYNIYNKEEYNEGIIKIKDNNKYTIYQKYISNDYNNKIINEECFKINIELIEMLIKYGVDINVKDRMNKMALDYILENKMYILFDNEIILNRILKNNKILAFEKMIKIIKIDNMNNEKIKINNDNGYQYKMIINHQEILNSRLESLEEINGNIPINIKYIFTIYTIIQNIYWYKLLNKEKKDKIEFNHYFFDNERGLENEWKKILNINNTIDNLTLDIIKNEELKKIKINNNSLNQSNKSNKYLIELNEIKKQLNNIDLIYNSKNINMRYYKKNKYENNINLFFNHIFKEFYNNDNAILYTYLWSFIDSNKLQEKYLVHLRLFDNFNDLLNKNFIILDNKIKKFNNIEQFINEITNIEKYMKPIYDFIDMKNNSIILSENPLLLFQINTCIHILSSFLGSNLYVNLEKIFYQELKNIKINTDCYETVKMILHDVRDYILSNDIDDGKLSYSFIKITLMIQKKRDEYEEKRTIDELFEKIIDLIINGTKKENNIIITSGIMNNSIIIENIKKNIIPYYLILYQNILQSLLDYSDSYYRFILNSYSNIKMFNKIIL